MKPADPYHGVHGKKIIGALVGAALGWLVHQAVTAALEDLGIPPQAAALAGAVVGGLVS